MRDCQFCPGKCCIIFNIVQLTGWEAMSGKYKMEKRKIHNEDVKEDEEKFCIKRKKVFLGEFGNEVWMCYYLDPDRRICTIYPDRPDVCKKVSCQNMDYLRKTVSSQWQKLRAGTAACLYS